ncbi:MAG: putative lipid II flippase FtsW [Clostridiales bacterium]|nr:putative lipid II flippase FtsW [Clostridiales bacterium]
MKEAARTFQARRTVRPRELTIEEPRRPAVPREGEEVLIKVGGPDATLHAVIIILLIIGVVMVFSAGYYTSANSKMFNNDTYYFLKRQGLLAVAGYVIMRLISYINYRYWMRVAFLLYIISNLLLAGVLIFAAVKHGAQRWIEVPIIGQFQPSEVSKVAIIFMTAQIIYANKNILKNWGGFLLCCGLVGVTAALVVVANLSTAIIVAVIGLGIIFVASPHVLRFLVFGALGVGGVFAYVAFFTEGYRNERFDAWLDPFSDPMDTGFQIIQSLFAVASGGPFGLGIAQGRQKAFLPEAHNDFIFSIICEELGFVGAAFVLLLFGVLIWRGINIAMNAADTFGFLVATGIILLIATQVLINIAVVTNTIPSTGIPLPFVSYGGSALLITMFLMGVLLNISRYSKE